jgi:transposase-like protein
MIDFSIDDLLDDSTCLIWLERHLHAEGFTCPHGGGTERRLFSAQGQFPAYRCRACDGCYTLLTGTVFEKTRQLPATLVLLLRGVAKGVATARLARELGLSRTQLHTLRRRIQANLNDTAPTGMMAGTAFEADELDQHAGEKQRLFRNSRDWPQGGVRSGMIEELVAMQIQREPLEEPANIEDPVASPREHFHTVVEALDKPLVCRPRK